MTDFFYLYSVLYIFFVSPHKIEFGRKNTRNEKK